MKTPAATKSNVRVERLTSIACSNRVRIPEDPLDPSCKVPS